jgi:hypothetical protein
MDETLTIFPQASMTVALCPSVTVYPPLPQILDRDPPSYSTKKTLLEISSVQTVVCGEEVKGIGEGEGVKTSFC